MPELDLDDRAAIVMAHPDDEVLWAQCAPGRVGRVVLAYEELPVSPEDLRGPAGRALAALSAAGREPAARRDRRVRHRGLARPGRDRRPGWRWTAGPGAMLRLHRRGLPCPLRRGWWRGCVPRSPGVRTVITHSPWGEYGHEDHVQLFRAVDALRPELGFAVWAPGLRQQPLGRG